MSYDTKKSHELLKRAKEVIPFLQPDVVIDADMWRIERLAQLLLS